MQDHLRQFDNFIVSNKRIVGGLALLSAGYLAKQLTSSIYNLVRSQLISGYNLIERYGKGSYAVISACTDGIGKGFAIELAKRGFNLVMLVRNISKAEELSTEIKNTINDKIEIKIIQVDFQQTLQEGVIENAIEQLDNLDISLLVNNVGMYLNNASFELQSTKDIINMVSMNIGSQILLTRYLIKRIRTREAQTKNGKRGGIINLSSVTALHPLAGFAIYGAAKSFNDYFSQAIGEEYKNELDVLSLKPGWVATPMTNGFKSKQFEISPQQCAFHALEQLGRYAVTHGHIYHEITAILSNINIKKTNEKMRGYTRYLLQNENKQNVQQS